ncbi:MAG TPA: redoxin domain-containing protein [Ferruginibacter sp.]|nr:redoxin domain-containing protein [Ferruginibacter sp.]
MKKSLLILCLLVLGHTIFAQSDTAKAPYQRFPTFPPFKFLKPDSSYFEKEELPKKSAVMLMLFASDCSHCQHETAEMLKVIDQFKKKKVQIVMITPLPFDSMMVFRERYQLAKYNNITVLQDNKIMLPAFYSLRNFPFLAFYNRNKELIDVFTGSMPMEQILKKFE